ncbi:coproporphyrinogen III oxidase [Clostridium saccharoperbutylacetonicum]|jgi:oxygen-independent coproporphyrinogen-3 oxidase|uniref:coproporphyrinogen III oxidase n=1 Tax=Clostridium saccharoperbutylacetonicum TaxID=36745 RepID=UPI000983E653|nr:coproporphyrinogen III oxidase [Clostridium saccharoperbutylacetonicum]AQR95074.1 oxygen-independent coproporphyrinogen-III oxidase-like protein HemZ [Clostridium saccharoperbutylacetonicum]NSB30921.1 oxygen-independent coproporphyrinogen-3 oxidase [Clostridium saccharoperbutylacetonicum]
MEVKINLNNLKYRYEVYQLFNVYFSMREISFIEKEEADYNVYIDEETLKFKYKDYYKEESLGEDIKNSLRRFLFLCLRDLTNDIYPWGILIGIRPSKIALKLLNEGHSEEEVIEIFKKKYVAHADKAKLCIKVAKAEERIVNKDKNNIAVYVGMAFCPTKCLYCSFTSNPIGIYKKMVKPYIEALIKEIQGMSEYIKEKNLNVESVYFGGGTPTAVNDEEFAAIMKEIYNNLIKDNKVKEFTVECGRPDTLTREKLKTMKESKVDRISINPQTMNDDTLNLIGRTHSSEDIKEKFKLARELGFNDINMDIIIGLPGETHKEVLHTKNELIKLKPDSITVHGLALKRGSRMYEEFILKKGIEITPQEEIIKMYEESRNLAENLGISPYYMYRQKNMVGNMENLGYAKEGKECIYNIQMIEERQTVIALGAAAVSKVIFLEEDRLERFPNLKDLHEYISRIDEMIEKKKMLLDTLYN